MAPSRVTVRRGYFAEDELRRFLRCAHDEVELLWWVLMADAGMRVGEVRALRFEEIRDNSVRIQGKGRKVRLVPVTSRVERIKIEGMNRYHLGGSDEVCIFSARSVQRRFETCLSRAGIRKQKLCPHSLRHTFATRLLVAGVDIHRVGVLLGHASTQTTVGYLHTNEDSLRDARDRLEQLNREYAPPGTKGAIPEREGVSGASPEEEAPSRVGYDEIGALITPGRGPEAGESLSGSGGSRSPLERMDHLL